MEMRNSWADRTAQPINDDVLERQWRFQRKLGSLAARCRVLSGFILRILVSIFAVMSKPPSSEWYVAIHPDGVERPGRVITGSRDDAELQAQSMIDAWLRRHGEQIPKRRQNSN